MVLYLLRVLKMRQRAKGITTRNTVALFFSFTKFHDVCLQE
jgi:hypothetical protein